MASIRASVRRAAFGVAVAGCDGVKGMGSGRGKCVTIGAAGGEFGTEMVILRRQSRRLGFRPLYLPPQSQMPRVDCPQQRE